MVTNYFEHIRLETGCNNPATKAQLKIANLKLKTLKLPELPAEFLQILELSNGLSNEGANVFGVEIKTNSFYYDLVEYNTHFFKNQPSNWLILGFDESFYFVYDAQKERYTLIDQDSFFENISSQQLEPVLKQFLRLEYE